jgi:D-alanyl-D-alanine carboxypeptidase
MKEITTTIMSLAIAAFGLLPFSPTPSRAELPSGDWQPITIDKYQQEITASAKSIYIEDSNSRTPLYTKSDTQSLPIASLTKLMTVYLVLRDKNLTEDITIPKEITTVQGGGSVVAGLSVGDQVKAEDVIRAALVPSANDAAVSLATWHSGSIDEFVNNMNDTAKSLGMNDTIFKNPTGLDEIGHVSSAKDLALLTHYLLEFDLFREIIKTKSISIKSASGRVYVLNTTNELLYNAPSVRGVKTGYTQAAGECLITLSEREGREIITVVLGSEDRFGESRNMINLAFGLNYE